MTFYKGLLYNLYGTTVSKSLAIEFFAIDQAKDGLSIMKHVLLLVVVSAISMPLGCGGNAEQSSKTATTSGSNGNPVASAEASKAIITPNEIFAMFADSIRRGDRETVNKLITEASRTEIQKQGIDLDPPGSPEASYKIGEFRFSDDDKDSGFVESLWIEPAQDGNPPQSTEVVWGVRLENGGWRICGLAIDMGKDQPAALVNFEDLEGTIVNEPVSQDKVATGATPVSNGANAPSSSMTGASGFAAPPSQMASPPSTDLRR